MKSWIGMVIAAVVGAAGYGAWQMGESESMLGEDVAGEFDRRFVQPMRTAMNNGSCDDRQDAFAIYLTASRQLEFIGLKAPENFDQAGFIRGMVQQCENEAYDVCVKDHDFSKMRIFGGKVARDYALLGMELDEFAKGGLQDKCLTFELETEITVDYGIPPVRMHYLTKAKIPLKLSKIDQESGGSEWSGEQMPSVESSVANPDPYCTYTVATQAGKAPMRVNEAKFHPDTVGPKLIEAARKPVAKVVEEQNALLAEIKADADARKKVNPDVAKQRQDRLEQLEREYKIKHAEFKKVADKYSGKEFNKPRKIDLKLHPGEVTVTVFIRCKKGGQGDFPAGPWYPNAFGPAFQSKYDRATGFITVVFEEKEITGGELFAEKSYDFEDPRGMKVNVELKLWHRPEPRGAPVAVAPAPDAHETAARHFAMRD